MIPFSRLKSMIGRQVLIYTEKHLFGGVLLAVDEGVCVVKDARWLWAGTSDWAPIIHYVAVDSIIAAGMRVEPDA